jgi:hypothetical protein
MAAGAHVVSSDAGGLREIVIHDETGTSCYANDPESLAWAILRVLRDPERASRLAERARERLYTDFDWGNIADQTIAIYDQVWAEFLDSYWAADTVWPVSPGAAERAEKLKLTDKAKQGVVIERPRVNLTPGVALVEEADDETVAANLLGT